MFYREIVLLAKYHQRHGALFSLFRNCVVDAMARKAAKGG
jgi:hypothetical protein